MADIKKDESLSQDIKKRACALVENINDRLHANGEIGEEAESKISEYLSILDHIHKQCVEKEVNRNNLEIGSLYFICAQPSHSPLSRQFL